MARDDGSFGLPAELFFEAARRAGELMAIVDDAGTIVWANELFRALGYEPADMVGRLPLEFIHPDDVERAILALASLDSPNASVPGSYKLLRKDGSYEPMDSAAAAFVHDGRTFYHFTFRPNPFLEAQTEMLAGLAADQPIHHTLELLVSGLSRMRAGARCAISLDVDGERLVVGTLASELLGVVDGVQDTTPNTPWGDALDRGKAITGASSDTFAPEVIALAASHGVEAVSVFPVPDPERDTAALFVVWFDAGLGETAARALSLNLGGAPRDLVQVALERRAERRRLEHLALHDPLTGLANRARFLDELRWAVLPPTDAEPGQTALAVIYLDLDDFKPINDRFGHDAGDRTLNELAERFRAAVRPRDLVARIGGDEFAVLCADLDDRARAEEIAARLVTAASEELSGIGPEVRVGASVGIAYVDDAHAADADQLLLMADEALYAMKRARKR